MVINDQINKLVQKGPSGILKGILHRSSRLFHKVRTGSALEYRDPTDQELHDIERRIQEQGISCNDYIVDLEEFREFVQHMGFPLNYHGGITGGVYEEKLLEHFIAWKFLRLSSAFQGVYVDVAACSSPWARLLRDKGIEAYAIDLSVPAEHSTLSYYRQEDATKTSFKNESISGGSLQCAYEMFVGENDIAVLTEFARILKPDGRVVISPLYTHTRPCFYQSPEYFGKPVGDPGAQRYVRRGTWGVPFSRKYSPETLKTRVWDTAIRAGLIPKLYVLRNKKAIGSGIYLHFVLILEKSTSG